MLNSPFSESLNGHIVEPEMQPAVFQEVLNWIYSDRVSEGAVDAMGEYLLLAANKYGCEALKQQCEVELCRGLSVENASARLVLSDQAEADQLKEACVDFIKGKAAEVMQSSGWPDVVTYNSGLLMAELMAAMAGIDHSGKGKKRSAGEAELDSVDSMKVPELRAALSERSLDTSGLKAQLVGRLKAAFESSGKSSRSAIDLAQ